jgi:hypothetical protein
MNMTKWILSFLLVCFVTQGLTYSFAFGQTGDKQSCRVEIYLLKRTIPNADTTEKELSGSFNITLADLQDTAFIKDTEIISYIVQRNTAPSLPNKTARADSYGFNVTEAAIQRVNSLSIPLCCGRQFAVVANGKICYAGYFWNLVSSFGCNGITAFAFGDIINILGKLPGYDSKPGDENSRNNELLFNCLKSTNRLIKK